MGPEFRMLTRGAEKATDAEIEENPRATPVRMRAAERISGDSTTVGEAGS
jgi:16S rRNA (cytosine1402-N4)-methyltransferase